MNNHSVFHKYFPVNTADYAFDLWQQYGFHFKVSRSRNTKLGDYRYNPKVKKHTITVNHDLNPYAFLVTYVHEVAHLVTFEQHGSRVQPHGIEWKTAFKELMQPVLIAEVFPADLLATLTQHMANPKASSLADPALARALHKYDLKEATIYLSDLQEGAQFILDKRVFEKQKKRRSRALCLELKTGKYFTVSEMAQVTPVE